MDDAKISVIIPIYRVEQYLCRCIESVAAQTHENLEIILVDDGSPDNCGLVCDRYSKQDGRIVVIHQENSGVSAARNAGLRAATGEWIGFVDGDDWVEPDMYADLLRMARTHDAGVAQCGLFLDDPDDSQELFCAGEERLLSGTIGQWSAGDWKGVGNSTCNKIYRADCLCGVFYDTDCLMGEDLLFNLHALQGGCGLVLGEQAKYHYVQHEESACHSLLTVPVARSHRAVLKRAIVMTGDGSVAQAYFRSERLRLDMHICSKMVNYPERGLNCMRRQICADLRRETWFLLNVPEWGLRARVKFLLMAWAWPVYRGLRCLQGLWERVR